MTPASDGMILISARRTPDACNVIVLEAEQYQKRNRILASLLRFRSTTRYDNTIILALRSILLDMFLFLFFNFGSYSFRRSPLFRLSL
jgi:hypothetical protein